MNNTSFGLSVFPRQGRVYAGVHARVGVLVGHHDGSLNIPGSFFDQGGEKKRSF